MSFFQSLPQFSLAAAVLLSAQAVAASARAQEKVTFDDDLVAIMRQRCSSCHNPTARKADLDVTTYLSLMEGGASGKVIEPGDPDGSYLFALVTHEAEPYMPLGADKMPDQEIELLRTWIEGGALENQGSKAVLPNRQAIAAVEQSPGVRPEVVPMPPRMVLEPFFHTERAPVARSLATSPWAPLVAVAGQRQILLYHSETLELLGVLPFPEGQPNIVRFSGDGALLLAGGGRPAASGKVVVWDVASGERVFEVGDELDAVMAADISADRTQIALGGQQRVVRVYSTDTGELQYEITKHTDWVLDVKFSPDGVLLATADRNGGLHLWEAHTGHEYLTLGGHSAAVTSLSWRSDSNILASGSEDSSVRLWEPENGTQVKTWNPQGAILALEFARDGRLVTGGRDQIARLWDPEGKQLLATAALGEVIVSVSYCDETDRLIAGALSGVVRVFPAEDAAALGSLATNPPLLADRLQTAGQQLEEKLTVLGPLADAKSKSELAAASLQTALVGAQLNVERLRRSADELSMSVKAGDEGIDAETSSRLEAIRQELAAAAEQVVALKAQGNTADAAADSAREAALAAESEVDLARQETARWQAEIEFRDRILALQVKLREAKQLASERQLTVEQAHSALADAQSNVAAATSDLEEATLRLDQIHAEIREVRDAK